MPLSSFSFSCSSFSSAQLELDTKFRNHTCGLCGDYNGMQTYSEFNDEGRWSLPPSGSLAGAGEGGGGCPDTHGSMLSPPGITFSPIEFGNMQKINQPDTVCEDPEETEAYESCSEHVNNSWPKRLGAGPGVGSQGCQRAMAGELMREQRNLWMKHFEV